jgi:long-chain acyl-CoA synthetase
MTELGFWRMAAADPDRVALIDPEGVEHTAGELADAANRVSHGLRALGLDRGDTVACVLPNGLEFIELYLGAMQIGLYLTPVNHHLVGPEIAYIVNDSEAGVLVGHERFTDEMAKALTEVSLPTDRVFMVGEPIEGTRPFADLVEGQPTTAPDDRVAGSPMHYTSGTTGRPKGVKRGLTISGRSTRASRGCSACSPSTTTCTSPDRPSTTRPCSCGRPTPCTWATRSCSWTSGLPSRCSSSSSGTR